MALFGKKKSSSKESKDIKNVKEASQSPPPMSSAPEPTVSQNATTPGISPANDPFVNPFEQAGGVPPPAQGISSQPTSTPDHHEDLFSGSPASSPFQPAPTTMQGGPQPITEADIQEMVDETVEKIIEEKWDKVVTSVEKVVSWKDSIEQDLNLMKEDFGKLRQSFEKLEKKLVGKLSDYDKDILDVSSEIKALEKVFQKITPTLVNNVNELGKITADLRGVSEEKESKKK